MTLSQLYQGEQFIGIHQGSRDTDICWYMHVWPGLRLGQGTKTHRRLLVNLWPWYYIKSCLQGAEDNKPTPWDLKRQNRGSSWHSTQEGRCKSNIIHSMITQIRMTTVAVGSANQGPFALHFLDMAVSRLIRIPKQSIAIPLGMQPIQLSEPLFTQQVPSSREELHGARKGPGG